jgi:hypothetical protein
MFIGTGVGLTTVRSGGGFSPHSLFSGTAQGAYYPASADLLFKGYAGEGGNVSASDDQVGLMLDKRLWRGKSLEQFLAAQPELFDVAYADSTVSAADPDEYIENGFYVLNRVLGGTASISIATNLVPGKTYRISGVAAPMGSQGGHRIDIRNTGASLPNFPFSSVIPFSYIFKAGHSLLVMGNPNTGFSWGLERASVSLKEIPGSHALQTTPTSQPKYKPSLLLGPELIGNGSFDNSAGWTLGGQWTVANGLLTSPAGAPADYARNINTQFEVGKTYAYAIDVLASSGTDFVQLYSDSGLITSFASGPRRYEGTFVANNNRIRIRGVSPNVAVSVDNLSVREVVGVSSTGYRQYDGVDDYLISNATCGPSGNTLAAKITVPTGAVGGARVPVGVNGVSPTQRFYLAVGADGLIGGAVGTASTSTIIGTTDVRGQTGVAVLVADPVKGEARLYWNGVLEHVSPLSGGLPTHLNMYEGARNNSGVPDLHFGGAIWENLMVQRALTPSEVTQLTRYWS